jgi:flavin-dependent dehydrogenase
MAKPAAEFDVVVVGGGPAGLTVATLLTGMGHSAIVLERSGYDRFRPGETFGGELIPLLRAAGLWEQVQAVPMTPFRGVRSTWGDTSPQERSALFNPYGEGWHVDRLAFDAALAKAASQLGVDLRLQASPMAIESTGNHWLVKLRSGDSVTGRFLVDASGRNARATASCLPARRWLPMDRMVALMAKLAPPRVHLDPMLELETSEDGWWYSVPQPDGGLLVCLMTDADLLSEGTRTGLTRHFSGSLARTTHTARRCAGSAPKEPPWVAPANSGVLLPDRGVHWMAIGDAAMACDPLGGNGVARAIRSALDAAPAIDLALSGRESDGRPATSSGNPSGAFGSQRSLPTTIPGTNLAMFLDYLELRSRYYLSETRFPEASFWARRHPPDWHHAPLSLDPRQVLRTQGVFPHRKLINRAESLIPPTALRALLRNLRTPKPAHEALAGLRCDAPLGDRRLLVGLQQLVALGVVELSDAAC